MRFLRKLVEATPHETRVDKEYQKKKKGEKRVSPNECGSRK
jgi:hypothetical protein